MANNWSHFRHDLQHTGRSSAASIKNPKVRWEAMKEKGHVLEILIGPDDTVYVPHASRSDGCTAFKASSGIQKWFFETNGICTGTALSNSGETLYLCDMDWETYAVDTISDEAKWTFRTNDWASYPTVDTDDNIYLGTLDTSLYALNSEGVELWRFWTDGLRTFTHSNRWYNAGEIEEGPAISKEGILYFGARDHNVYALDRMGNRLWSKNVGFPVNTAVSIGHDGTIFCGSYSTDSENEYVAALTPDGEIKWIFPTKEKFLYGLAIGEDNTVYVGTDEGNVFAIDANGKLKWSFKAGGSFPYAVSLTADNIIYGSNSNGNLYALKDDGTLYWSLNLQEELSSSPTIGADSTIYVAAFDYKVFAIEGDS